MVHYIGGAGESGVEDGWHRPPMTLHVETPVHDRTDISDVG